MKVSRKELENVVEDLCWAYKEQGECKGKYEQFMVDKYTKQFEKICNKLFSKEVKEE